MLATLASRSILTCVSAIIPARAGIGLRAAHYADLIASKPAIGWLEVHSENYFGAGGSPLFYLEAARALYPLSLHGVGLSLGATDPLNFDHLQKLKALIHRFEPGLVSEHLCWGSLHGHYLNDLLPLPYTEEVIAHVAARIQATQDFLKRQILIENVSSYLQYQHSTMPEWEFLTTVVKASGCGILLDVNNIYVSARNHGFDPLCYIQALPASAIQEIHLAGHAINHYPEGDILIDNHGTRVCAEVWQLYDQALDYFGPTPTLIEWDTDIPPLATLLQETRTADASLEKIRAAAI